MHTGRALAAPAPRALLNQSLMARAVKNPRPRTVDPQPLKLWRHARDLAALLLQLLYAGLQRHPQQQLAAIKPAQGHVRRRRRG